MTVVLFIIKKNKLLSFETKKFLFYELSLVAICINVIMAFTLKTYPYFQYALSIGSLCVGIAYLLILTLTSVLLVVKKGVFPVLKIFMLKPMFFILAYG